jgi:hypothetical protein
MPRFIYALLLMLSGTHVFGTTLFKCKDASGHVTFTQQACAGGLAGETIFVRRGGAGMSLGPSSVVEETAPDEKASSGKGKQVTVTVIGPSSSCAGGSDQEIRSAIVRNQVYEGMTAKQAEQSWGKPGEVNRSSGGSDQWVYYRGDGRMQFVYVDPSGCVTGWN